MVSDDNVHAARVGVINGFIRGDARIASDDELCAIINDRLENSRCERRDSLCRELECNK